MVLAHHLIITAYGFWLPNDPRGSWSDFVRAWELLRFGPATKTIQRRSTADVPHDVSLRLQAKQYLARPPVEFTGDQARAIARGIGDYCRRSDCSIFACAILPSHMHMVVQRHRYSIERVSQQIKGAATRSLITESLHPFAIERYHDGTTPTPWARKCWKVFLNSGDQVRCAIQYVQENPLKEGKKAQPWRFVRPAF